MTNLPKYTEVSNPTIKSLINLMDMIRCGYTLRMVKEQAKTDGFESVYKSKTFKLAKSCIMQELKNNGLILI